MVPSWCRPTASSDAQQQLQQAQDELDNLDQPDGPARRGLRRRAGPEGPLDADIAVVAGQGRRDRRPSSATWSRCCSDIAVTKFTSGGSAALSPLFSDAATYSAAEQKDALGRVALDTGEATSRRTAVARRRARQGDRRTCRPSRRRPRPDRHPRAEAEAFDGARDAYTSRSSPRRRPTSVRPARGRGRTSCRRRAERRVRPHAAGSTARQQRHNGRQHRPPRPRWRWRHSTGDAGGGSSGQHHRARRHPQPTPRPCRARPASPWRPPTASSACRTGSQPSRPVWRSTAPASPSTHGSRRRVPAAPERARSTPSSPHVPKDQAQPGDLIFYYSPIGHVGIYVGGGQMIHAAAHRQTVERRAGALEQGRRRRPPGLTPRQAAAHYGDARAGHRHRAGHSVAGSPTSTAPWAPFTFDLIAGGRRTSPSGSPAPTARASSCAGRRSATCWPPPTTWRVSTASSPRSAPPACPCRRRSGCAPTRGERCAVLRDGLRRRRRARQRREGGAARPR